MITKHFQKVNKTFWIVIRRSSTFEHFPSSSPLMHKWRRKKSLKTQSNDHRVVTRGQKPTYVTFFKSFLMVLH